MKITKRQLRKIIREAIEVLDVDNGYVLTFGDGPEDAAPDAAVPELFRRLGIQAVRNGPRDFVVREDDWEALEDETKGKRMARRARRRATRLNNQIRADMAGMMEALDWKTQMEEERRGGGRGYTDMDLAIVRDFMNDRATSYFDLIDYYMGHVDFGDDPMHYRTMEEIAVERIDRMSADGVIDIGPEAFSE